MKKKNKKLYTVMFVPDDNGRTFYFRISRGVLYSLVFFLVIFTLGITALIIKTGEIGAKLQFTYSLLNEKRRLNEENEKLKKVVKKIESIEQATSYLRRLASTIGEKGLEVPVSQMTYNNKEIIFEEDSLDAVIVDLRTDESEVYKQLGILSATKEELYAAIPSISPVDGWVTKKFIKDNENPSHSHLGVDFAAKEGTPIRSTAPGTVEDVVNEKYFGLIVTIKHKFGFVTRYGHCMQILVTKGDRIERGQTIALLGNTGSSSAPHLHYEIIKDGKNVDPLKYMFDRI